MRKVIISNNVLGKIEELEYFLIDELKLSEMDAKKRSARLRTLVNSLANPGDYALCRLRKWRELGYRCALFEGWVFAYEILEEGVIIRDMSHGKLLSDVT
jgi:hypothetical protein